MTIADTQIDRFVTRKDRRRMTTANRMAHEVIAKQSLTYATLTDPKSHIFTSVLEALRKQRPSVVVAIAYLRGSLPHTDIAASTTYESLCHMATVLLVAEMHMILSKLPSFTHTCRFCVFLGTIHEDSKAPEKNNLIDLYYCEHHEGEIAVLTQRFGNLPSEQKSIHVHDVSDGNHRKSPVDPHFYVAFCRSHMATQSL